MQIIIARRGHIKSKTRNMADLRRAQIRYDTFPMLYEFLYHDYRVQTARLIFPSLRGEF